MSESRQGGTSWYLRFGRLIIDAFGSVAVVLECRGVIQRRSVDFWLVPLSNKHLTRGAFVESQRGPRLYAFTKNDVGSRLAFDDIVDFEHVEKIDAEILNSFGESL